MKPLATNIERVAVPVQEQVVTFAARPSSTTQVVNQIVDPKPLVSDHTELSMKSVVKRQVIVMLNEHAKENNQLRQHIIQLRQQVESSKNVQSDLEEFDRKQIKFKTEINAKVREINVLNSEMANKDKEIEDLHEEKYKLEKEKSEVKREYVEKELYFFEKERALRKKLSRDYDNKLRRHGPWVRLC